MDPVVTAAPHVSVERTKKKYKFQYIVGWLLILLSPVAMVSFGAALVSLDIHPNVDTMTNLTWAGPVLGVFWLIVTRIRVWWDHD